LGAEIPFKYEIINNSSEVLNRVKFQISANRPHYSDDVQLLYTYYGTDRIIKVGQRWSECGYTAGVTVRDIMENPANFIWKGRAIFADFGKKE
jgi:hypothetical protein